MVPGATSEAGVETKIIKQLSWYSWFFFSSVNVLWLSAYSGTSGSYRQERVLGFVEDSSHQYPNCTATASFGSEYKAKVNRVEPILVSMRVVMQITG